MPATTLGCPHLRYVGGMAPSYISEAAMPIM